MKDFNLICGEKSVTFHFPTDFKEIEKSYFTSVTNNVNIADNYSLIALVYHDTLGKIILTRKQNKKGITSGVVPVFVKAGNTDSDFINSANVKDKIIISSTQLSLAQHVIVPQNVLSLDYFIKWLDKDNTVSNRYQNNYGKEECYFVEFKLVPNCDIVGFYVNDKPTVVEGNFVTIEAATDDSTN